VSKRRLPAHSNGDIPHVVRSSLLDLRHIPCDEAERDRRLNVTILNVVGLLWAGVGVALVCVALDHPQQTLWALGVESA
jgi:hypothetical protein